MNDRYTEWKGALKPKQRKRTYRHFDKQLDLDNDRDFARVVHTLQHVHAHQFLPFIKYVRKHIRYRRGVKRVPERSLKHRPIMYASHLDAQVYGYYAWLWGQKYEQYLETNNIASNVIAYRKIEDEREPTRGKSNIAFAQEVFTHIQQHGDCVVIVADISKFFDTLNHRVLKDKLSLVLGGELNDAEYKVLRSLTNFRYVLAERKNKKRENLRRSSDLDVLLSKVLRHTKNGHCSVPQVVYEEGREIIKTNKTTVGIPQGSPLSGLLANIYLCEYDTTLVGTLPDVLYRRYSDDIVVVCPTDKANAVYEYLLEQIREYKLSMNPSKVHMGTFVRNLDSSVSCVHVCDGAGKPIGKKKHIDYLGFEFDGQAVRVRNKTLQNAYRKAVKRIEKCHARQAADFKHKRRRAITASTASKGSGLYLDKARQGMTSVGENITSQQKKYGGHVRKTRSKLRSAKTGQ